MICIFLYFYDFNNSSLKPNSRLNSITNLKNQTEQIRQNGNFTYLSSLILDIYEKAKKRQITLNILNIKNAKILIELNARDKKSVYEFLKEFRNMKIETIYFDEKIKRFRSNASFKIHRR